MRLSAVVSYLSNFNCYHPECLKSFRLANNLCWSLSQAKWVFTNIIISYILYWVRSKVSTPFHSTVEEDLMVSTWLHFALTYALKGRMQGAPLSTLKSRRVCWWVLTLILPFGIYHRVWCELSLFLHFPPYSRVLKKVCSSLILLSLWLQRVGCGLGPPIHYIIEVLGLKSDCWLRFQSMRKW